MNQRSWHLAVFAFVLSTVVLSESQPKPKVPPPPPNQTADTAKPVQPPATPIAAVDSTTRFPDTVSPGQTVTFTGSFPGGAGDKPSVQIHADGSDKRSDPKDTQVNEKRDTVSVTLPDTLTAGRYYLSLSYGSLTNYVVPSELRVVSDVQLDSAHPTTAYPNDKGSFNFDVIGRNFSPNVNDDNVSIAGQGSIISTHGVSEEDCNSKTGKDLPCLWYEAPDKIHVVGYKGEAYQGPISFSVTVGSAKSTPKPLVLARLTRTQVRIWSIALFCILGFVIYRLVARGMRENVIDGRRYSPLYSFVLDRETDTFSLSKFQLLLFSATFVFGYLYVFLCAWLVQWHFVLPDVPSSLSAILGISAGTTIVSAGATSARGSKGAGGTRPSPADFITTGGQVVPERFQFFVWTLLACFGFIALLLSQDPATLTGFPEIPQGLLYVMGVSSAGYLGGKLTRAPGPVVRNIAWDNTNQKLVVQGENLSNQGDYFIDGKKLPIVIDSTADQNAPKKPSMIDSTPQDQASDRTFCSELRVTIHDQAGLDLGTGDHVFRIMNKDAQFADARFTSDAPGIDSVSTVPPAPGLQPLPGGDPQKVIPASTANTVIRVQGTGLRLGTTARWTQVGAQEPITVNTVQNPDGSLQLTLVPGGAGKASLLMITPNGFSAVAAVSVVSPPAASSQSPGSGTPPPTDPNSNPPAPPPAPPVYGAARRLVT